jgi:hypothetical protein
MTDRLKAIAADPFARHAASDQLLNHLRIQGSNHIGHPLDKKEADITGLTKEVGRTRTYGNEQLSAQQAFGGKADQDWRVSALDVNDVVRAQAGSEKPEAVKDKGERTELAATRVTEPVYTDSGKRIESIEAGIPAGNDHDIHTE